MPGWGPAHTCEKCGQEVQYHSRPGQYPRLFEAGAVNRHDCPALVEPSQRDQLECLCGVDVEVIDGVRFERNGAVHSCPHCLPDVVRPVVVGRPRRIVAVNLTRESPASAMRGVIRLP